MSCPCACLMCVFVCVYLCIVHKQKTPNGCRSTTCSAYTRNCPIFCPCAGLDCSNYAAWLYNFAFGYYPTSSIGQQACSPTKAPGVLLNLTAADQASFAPGDLIYVTPTRKGQQPPLRVSHVIVWTGWMVDFSANATGPLASANLVAAVSPKSQSSALKCMAVARAAGKPVYVISDSTYNGPALRPFCGWYSSSFSHARRIINPSVAVNPVVNDDSVAYYNSATEDCMSTFKLSA
jgi:hypothetical protein